MTTGPRCRGRAVFQVWDDYPMWEEEEPHSLEETARADKEAEEAAVREREDANWELLFDVLAETNRDFREWFRLKVVGPENQGGT